MSFNEADAQKRSPVVQTPQDCMTALNSYLVLGDDKTEDDNNSEIPSLSIKGDCEEYKTNATACCSNPNNCAGLAMDIAKTSAPTLPGLFVAYKQYRTSEKAASGELSHEGAQAKVCDVNNKAAIGNFAGQLFSQMSTMFEATCKDKIEQCQNDCNGQIETFRETFKTCFSDFPSDGTVEGLINVAKLCADVKDLKNVPNTLAEAIKKFNPCFINTINNDVVKSCEFGHHGVSEDQNCEHIEDKTIGHILLFAKAYKNSSALEKFPFNKMEELSENSDGKKIVNCSHQPDRVVTQRKHPGAPVSPPFIQMCHAVTDSFRNGPPTPVVPGNPTNPVDMTGNLAGQLPETGRNPPDWMLPGEEDGLIDDGLPDPDNSPDTVKTSDSPNGSSPGSPVSSVAGGSPSGGLGGPSSQRQVWFSLSLSSFRKLL